MSSSRSRTGQPVDLLIGGMTCASCAARVEKKLNAMPGVDATVNYATEKATVAFVPELTTDDLVRTVEATGYTARVADLAAPPDGEVAADSALRTARTRLVVSAVLTVPVVALAMIPAWQFDHWAWVSLVLATPVVFYGGWPFHRAAWLNLRHRAATMDTLVSLGTLAAYAWSVYALVFGSAGAAGATVGFSFTASGSGTDEIYLETAAGVTSFVLVGRYLEARAKRRAGAAIRALLALGAKDVAVLRDGVETRVPVEDLAVGDDFVVRPGERIATDGVVVVGTSALDASMLTGEAMPREVGPGDLVAGATVNVDGRIVVRARAIGEATQLARIRRLVDAAQSGKAPVQRLADRISGVFVPAVLVLALITLAGWLLLGHGAGQAFTAAVAVLVIACPCALGLATPTALMVGTGRGAELGIVIRGPEVLESTRSVDTVVLDKTGTVTEGRMSVVDVVVDVVAEDDIDGRAALVSAAAVEVASEHPVAAAIVRAARDAAADPLPSVTEFTNRRGLGVEGLVDGRRVIVGRRAFLADRGMPTSARLERIARAAERDGRTVVAVGHDGAVQALLVVADTIKPGSAAAIDALRELGLRPVLLTGDNAAAAGVVARAVGIEDVRADETPSGKLEAVRGLQERGAVVAMVGDGVNDAAALVQADLGLAMGTGTDVALEAADIALVRGDLDAVVDAIRLARRTLSVIKGNLFWALAYNVAALPLAVLGLLDPMIAGAAMAFSSLFVVMNSLRLRRFRRDRDNLSA